MQRGDLDRQLQDLALQDPLLKQSHLLAHTATEARLGPGSCLWVWGDSVAAEAVAQVSFLQCPCEVMLG